MLHQEKSTRRIRIFDTTLRDGEQAPGNAMRPEQKLELALALESIGVDVVEAGFPSSSPSDREAVRRVASALTSAYVGTLSRAVPEDIRIAADVGGTERHHMQIMATGSETHLTYKRGIEQAEAQAEVVESIAFARSLGVQNVTLGLEDASRGSDALLRPLITESIAAGANAVTVADTTGCLVPGQYGDLIRRIRSWIDPEIIVATHCHEDLGLSLANALAGIEAGADEVQTTLAGVGERAGNTPLEELIAVLTCNGDAIGATTSAKPEGLYAAFETLCSTIALTPPRNKAIFGVNAFATQAGIHQAGMLRAPITYEYVDPAQFGRQRSMLVGRHSGRAVLRYALGELGLPIDEDLVDRIYTEQVENRTGGECIDLGDLRELMLAAHAAGPGGPA
jgi:2-isopropylmalate synthase